MNFRDHWTTDENGQKILFTVEMQRRLSQAGLPIEPSYISQLQLETPAPSAPRRQREEKHQHAPPADPPKEPISQPSSIQIDPMTGKYIGRIKWYNVRKKYGFIMRGGGEEIFFHSSSSEHEFEMLNEGEWVLYDVEETHKGPEATDLEPYKGETPE